MASPNPLLSIEYVSNFNGGLEVSAPIKYSTKLDDQHDDFAPFNMGSAQTSSDASNEPEPSFGALIPYETNAPITKDRQSETPSNMMVLYTGNNNHLSAIPDDARPFGKNGLQLVELASKQPCDLRRFKKSRQIKFYAANFRIPERCLYAIRMSDKKNGAILESEGLEERLNGWIVDIRRRDNGQIDKYYRHLYSKKMFRSKPGVENFIFYNILSLESISKPRSRKRSNERDTSNIGSNSLAIVPWNPLTGRDGTSNTASSSWAIVPWNPPGGSATSGCKRRRTEVAEAQDGDITNEFTELIKE